MYIKSIVLEGFKSYGPRTEINGFDPNFNAITGLNGSGKSNILDGICFLLGISNLTHVRATSMQDLIYKNGTAGINRAAVSIIFDNTNRDSSPPGLEGSKEIVITRQINMSGKNKYLLNGTTVTNKKIHDMFCAIQMNVNNPHFLIMQGKVTKVLNMKPQEVLGMLEEAAGTRMYDEKRQSTLKAIDRKNVKLEEYAAIINEELTPRLNKLREERAQYLEYQRIDRELVYMQGIYKAWQYICSKRSTVKAREALEMCQVEIGGKENQIGENEKKIEELATEVEEIIAANKSEEEVKAKELADELHEKQKIEAKAKAVLSGIEEEISSEESNKTALEKNLRDDVKALEQKETEMAKIKSLFDELKENNSRDGKAYAVAEKKYEALVAGMELNDEGEAETLQQQLMVAQKEATTANTKYKQADLQLTFCQGQLKEKTKQLGNRTSDVQKDQLEYNRAQDKMAELQRKLKKLDFSEERENELRIRKAQIEPEVISKRAEIDDFDSHRPYTTIKYADPETNFDRRQVNGTICRLFSPVDNKYCTALETAAGGRLYNVVVNSDRTSKKLLQRGNLQQRTTFIPLDKIRAHRMDRQTVAFAQNLVGKENCQPALSLIDYDKKLEPAMEFIFGNVFVCRDLKVAKEVTFHHRIRKRCVTLEGDVTDPEGTLSGGALQKKESILLMLKRILLLENELKEKEKELHQINAELSQMAEPRKRYLTSKKEFEITESQVKTLQQKLQLTDHYQKQEEIDNLKRQIEELSQQKREFEDSEIRFTQKTRELQVKIKDSAGNKERQLKETEREMKKLKRAADKSREEWEKREEEHQTLTMEISELKKAIEGTEEQLKASADKIATTKRKLQEEIDNNAGLNEEIKKLTAAINEQKAIISGKNKEVQKKQQQREKLKAKNDELRLKIQELGHELKKCEADLKHHQAQEQSAKKNVTDEKSIEEAGKMNEKDAKNFENRFREKTEVKNKLQRKVNVKAQSMYVQEEKEFNELMKKNRIVESDKKKLLSTVQILDEQRKNAIKLAYEQVSKDLGSIFSSLLPGANAKLSAPIGKTILDGIEIKVFLGGMWKNNLTELSGGQRSLAALSLILAMLLFKPAPIYILDEVDAALDLSHTQNIGQMLKSHFKQSQFVIVSLKDGMFNNANVLFKTKFTDGVSTISKTVNKV